MKTYKHLYEQITAFENLRLAFKRAAKGKRKKSDVAAFEEAGKSRHHRMRDGASEYCQRRPSLAGNSRIMNRPAPSGSLRKKQAKAGAGEVTCSTTQTSPRTTG
jgi:hypothetical protein